jgi:hypothetical protein
MDKSIYLNGHQVVNDLGRLKILRAPHPPCLSNISPCNFWIFGDFKEKAEDCLVQGPEESLMAYYELCENITFEELQMVFELWCDWLRWIVEHDGASFRK